MNILDITKLLSRLQIAKTNIDYAVRLLDDGEKKEDAKTQQVEVDKLLEMELGEPEETLGLIINYLESNEAQVSELNESAILIALSYSAGQN